MPTPALDLVAPVFDAVVYLTKLLQATLSGWAYLFSPSFRERTHKRWRGQRETKIAMETIGAAFGVLLSVLAVTWLLGVLLGVMSF